MNQNRYFPAWTVVLAIIIALVVFAKSSNAATPSDIKCAKVGYYHYTETSPNNVNLMLGAAWGYSDGYKPNIYGTGDLQTAPPGTTIHYSGAVIDIRLFSSNPSDYNTGRSAWVESPYPMQQFNFPTEYQEFSSRNDAQAWIDSGECEPCEDGTEWNGYECANPCSPEERLAKEEDCGGAEYLQNWSDETCSGNCYCEETPTDDLSTNQYKQVADFCGGPSRVEAYYSEICMGECKGCDSEYAQAVADCAAQGWSVDRNSPRADECIYECAVEPCLDEFLQKEEDCGFWGIDPSSKNYDNCTASCAQACDDQYDALKTKCGIAGVAWFDNDTCSGGCKDCEWSRDECDNSCVSGFGKTDCSQRSSEGNIVSVNYSKCECLSPSEVMNTPEGGEGETYDGKEFFNGTPGSHGGTVVKNPDGSYTESLGNGTTYKYSADGKTVTASDGNGKTLSVSKDGNTTTYTGTNEFGEFTRITLEANPDGTITKKTEQGNDINFESPELGPDLIVTDSEEETVEGETTTAIDGTVIDNPTYNEETEQPESTGPEITAQYQSSESYKWTDRVNYTAWNAAKDQWNTKSPSAIFNRTIEPYLQTFIKPGEVPQWTIAFPSVGVLPAFDIDIDLSPFDAVVPWFRFFIALGLVFVTFRNVPKLWSGES